MRRDMDLIRKILLKLEASERMDADVGQLSFELEAEGYSRPELSYHFELMSEAGLMKGFEIEAAGLSWLPQRLSWQGHDFLDAARNEANWREAKARIGGSVESAPFELWKHLLHELSRDALRDGRHRTPPRSAAARKRKSRPRK